MRILFVAPYPPSRIRCRSYGFIQQLATVHEVTVLALCSTTCEALDVQLLRHEGIMITAIIDKMQWKVLRSLHALCTGLPLQVAFDASPTLRSVLCSLLASGDFDLLHVEFIRALGVLPDILPIPTVWDAVDCISQLYTYGAHWGATPLMRLLGSLEARRVQEYERVQLWRFHDVLVTSERDRNALHTIAANDTAPTGEMLAEITVLPHGIDQTYFRPYVGERKAQTLVFAGKMSFHANVAAALLLAEQIMPRIWQKKPDVQLVIAGSGPPACVRRLARSSRITVTGYVDDLRPLIGLARVAVCPLPYAVGIQSKILEAMACGTPVVASTQAAAGLLAYPQQNLLIADTPDAFADAVLRLLDDPTLWTTIAENALSYVTTQHNWQHIIQQLTAVYERAVYRRESKD